MARVLFDCDGILSDVHQALLDFIYRETGSRFVKDDLTDWDAFKCLNMTHLERSSFLYEIRHRSFVEKMDEFTDACSVFFNMSKDYDDHDLVVVTSPYRDVDGFVVGQWVEERDRWLAEHLGLSDQAIIHTANKALIPGDVLIDDSKKNIAVWKKAYPRGHGILWKTPFNKINDCGADVLTDDWAYVQDYINAI